METLEDNNKMLTRKPAFGIVIMLLLFASAQALAERPRECKLISFGEVSLTVTSESVTFPVTVNGKSARMALNLGSAFSVFWTDAASTLSLRVRPYTDRSEITIGSARVTQAGTFASLTLAGMRIGKNAFLLASPDADWARRDAVGFLGMDFFQAVDLELDLAHGKMRLFSQSHCRGMGAYWAQRYAAMPLMRGASGEWWVPIELEGYRIAAALSSGEPTTTLSSEVTKKLYGFDESSPGIQRSTDATTGEPYHYRAMKLTAPGLEVINTPVSLVPGIKNCGLYVTKRNITSYTSCGDAYPMYIGLSVLSQLRLYFAVHERMLYYTAAD